MSEDRNLPATWAQRQRAQARGEFPVSREMAGALTVLGGFAALATLGPALLAGLRELASAAWADLPRTDVNLARCGAAVPHLAQPLAVLLWPLAGLLGWVVLIAVGVHWIQSGFRLHPGRLHWQWNRLRPAFGREGGWCWAASNAGLALARWLLLLVIAAASLWSARNDLCGLLQAPVSAWLGLAGGAIWRVSATILVAIGLMSWIDRRLARAAYERRLRMSEAEVREDLQADAIHPYLADRRRRPLSRGARGESSAAAEHLDEQPATS